MFFAWVGGGMLEMFQPLTLKLSSNLRIMVNLDPGLQWPCSVYMYLFRCVAAKLDDFEYIVMEG